LIAVIYISHKLFAGLCCDVEINWLAVENHGFEYPVTIEQKSKGPVSNISYCTDHGNPRLKQCLCNRKRRNWAIRL